MRLDTGVRRGAASAVVVRSETEKWTGNRVITRQVMDEILDSGALDRHRGWPRTGR